jgi:uncharacterized protein (TIGR00299 family) protein
MRIAYLDCFSGISGDMFLGALIDAGVSPELFEETVAALKIGARLEIFRVLRGGISATKVDVYVNHEKDLPREVCQEPNQHSHAHDSDNDELSAHEHDHRHGQDQEHSGHGLSKHVDDNEHSQGHHRPREHAHIHGRGLNEIRSILQDSSIPNAAKSTAIKIFEALGAAEAEIHGISIDKVHFHEVGAVDAIVDIVCAAVGADSLSIDEWVCSPLNVGGGVASSAHGTLPVPAPATLKLLGDAPVYSSGPQVELVTPTGAAIVKVLAARFASFPTMKIEKAGYGAGTREFSNHPNLLRLTIGDSGSASASTATASWAEKSAVTTDNIAVLEANLDDLSPQVLAYAMERLFGAGALDVFSIPVHMKKNRPGALLTVLARPEDANRLSRLIFAETTTLGIRRREEQRQTLTRRWETVDTKWGPVRMKIANMNGTVSNYAPEFEDCKRLAEEKQVPLRTVMQEAVQQYLSNDSKA